MSARVWRWRRMGRQLVRKDEVSGLEMCLSGRTFEYFARHGFVPSPRRDLLVRVGSASHSQAMRMVDAYEEWRP